MSDNPEGLHGVGGWLLFFVIALAVISPLRMVIEVYGILYGDRATGEAYGAAWGTLQAFEWGLVTASIAICWFLAFRLFVVQTWTTIVLTVAGIWLIGPLAVIIEALGIVFIAGLPIGAILGASVGDFVQPLIFCTIWTSYLMLSKRVANTYPRHTPPRVAQVFD